MKKFLPIITMILAASAGLTAIVMLAWNFFLVPAVGVSEIPFWMAAIGWVLLGAFLSIFAWLKALISFVTLSISLAIAKKKVQKTTADAQAELIKHFSMFEQEKRNE